jgi:hypothetical protein
VFLYIVRCPIFIIGIVPLILNTFSLGLCAQLIKLSCYHFYYSKFFIVYLLFVALVPKSILFKLNLIMNCSIFIDSIIEFHFLLFITFLNNFTIIISFSLTKQ